MRLILVVLVSMGCGPSAKDVQRARAASYSCEPPQLVEAMAAEMKERRMPLAQVDTDDWIVASEYRWHTSNGVPKQKGAAVVGTGDLAIAIIASVRRSGENDWRVVAEPDVLSHVVGSPRGQRLMRSDADWPDWADSKVDVYLVGLHARLKACAVATPKQ